MSKFAKVVIALILVAGVLATLVGTQLFHGRTEDERRNTLAAGTPVINDAASMRLGDATVAAQRISLASVAEWPTVAEFEIIVAEQSPDLPGEIAAAVVLRISETDLEEFVRSETAANPSFALSNLNPSPPPEGHLLVMRSVGWDVAVGTDLTTTSELGRVLADLPLSGTHALNDSLGSSQGSRDLLLAVRSRAEGPDDMRYASWTLARVDLPALLGDVHLAAGENFGARYEIDAIGSIGEYGADRVPDAATNRNRVPVGVVELDVETWFDGSSMGRAPSALIVLLGLLSTGALALVAYLLFALAANRRQARIDSIQARRDHLTGVPNRRWVLEHLTQLDEGAVAVLFCDLDRFKVVNDAAGHGAGDLMLVQVVDRLESVLEGSEKLARFGGDEFLVVCSDESDIVAYASVVAAKINQAMTEPFQLGASEFTTTMSIGIATTERASETSGEELIRAADVALGRCKQHGRNGAVIYNDSLRDAELDRVEFESDLRLALDEGTMVMHYQPIVDRDKQVVAYEALVRWQRKGELVPPGLFLPVVSEIGRMNDLGAIVLRLAMSEFSNAVGPDSSQRLHVNVDATQLDDPDFPVFVQEMLAETGIAPSRLMLELTEGDWFSLIGPAMPVLDQLGELGVHLAIDDFGAGHSNIGRALAVAGLSEIKLDRSLVRDMVRPRNQAFLVGFVRSLAHINVSVVAEGIETSEDFQHARETGVTRFQGYYFARPALASEISFSQKVTSTPTLVDSGLTPPH